MPRHSPRVPVNEESEMDEDTCEWAMRSLQLENLAVFSFLSLPAVGIGHLLNTVSQKKRNRCGSAVEQCFSPSVGVCWQTAFLGQL